MAAARTRPRRRSDAARGRGGDEEEGRAMSDSVERFDEKARREIGGWGRTVVRRGELLRHPVYTRFLHWSVAIFFVLSLLTGFAIYSPWLYRWLAPLLVR